MSSGFANPRLGIAISAGSGFVSTGTVTFANSNGVTFGAQASASSIVVTASVSAGAAITAIQSISAGTTRITSGEVVLSNSNGINFGVNGQTITAGLPKVSFWSNGAFPATSQSWATASATSNLHLQRVTMGMPIDATRADFLASGGSSWSIGIYTMSGSTASLASSGSAIATQNSYFWKSIPLGTWAITPGDYLVGMIVSSGSTVQVGGIDLGNFASSNFLGVPGGGQYTSYFAEGLYSVGVSGLPASIHVSDIVNSAEIRSWHLQMAGTF